MAQSPYQHEVAAQQPATVKKIVVIGPESTGKSTLCEQLSARYGTAWVPEYAREYLTRNGPRYSYDDLLIIAKNQLALEDELTREVQNGILFIDTDMYVMKVWCEFVFGRCHQWILDRIAERKYDFYLLTAPDLPWVMDELREYPDIQSRLKLFNMYKDCMVNQHVPWTEIRGTYSERIERAVKSTDEFLANWKGREINR